VPSPAPTFGIYLPQVGFTFAELLERALLCEELGFDALWLMDHLYPPELPDVPSFEAWTLATALLARTTRLRIGHLVLSATFRHPALLAKMATSLDVISGGRLELGIGSGSYQPEHTRAGLAWGSARERALVLAETLEILTRAFAGPRCDFTGQRFVVQDLPNLPAPAQQPRPPIHVGGAGERFTLPLVARWADVWNCPTYALVEADAKRAALARTCAEIGRDPATIGCSLEAVLVLVAERHEVEAARALALRRFAGTGWGVEAGGFVGTPDDVIARIRDALARGFSSFVFFTHDRAAPATLRLFAERVRPAFAAA
jgi:alkanesulfonate monooxygenase SsuD/methylene tetrahydromethanopterin reductase-like flavin-dependent oxidoreductase (luciferase family)